MKTTVLAILNSASVLQGLSNTEMKLTTAYRVKKLCDECNIINAKFEEKRIELLKKHAKYDKKEDSYSFPDKDTKALNTFNKAINEVVAEEIEIIASPLTLEELGGIEVKPNQLSSLEWFLDDVG